MSRRNSERATGGVPHPLLRPLINPRADEADFLFGQREEVGFVLGRRHVAIRISNMSDAADEHAAGAVAGCDHFTALPAFERGRQAIQP